MIIVLVSVSWLLAISFAQLIEVGIPAVPLSSSFPIVTMLERDTEFIAEWKRTLALISPEMNASFVTIADFMNAYDVWLMVLKADAAVPVYGHGRQKRVNERKAAIASLRQYGTKHKLPDIIMVAA